MGLVHQGLRCSRGRSRTMTINRGQHKEIESEAKKHQQESIGPNIKRSKFYVGESSPVQRHRVLYKRNLKKKSSA